MSRIRILGADPGLATFGLAVIDISDEQDVLIHAGSILTAKSNKKLGVLVAEDNVRRTRDLLAALAPLLAANDIRAICAERFSAPRNSSAAAKVALAWGALIAHADLLRVPIVQPSPQEVKLAVCGKRSASKTEVEIAMRQRYRGPVSTEALAEMDDNLAPSHQEHAFDAMAVAVACLDSDIIRAVRGRG